MADDAEVRKLVKSVHCVEDRLGVITAVKSMKHLVTAFKVNELNFILMISKFSGKNPKLNQIIC